MKKLVLFVFLVSWLLIGPAARAYDASDLATADKYYAEHSYQLAATAYAPFLGQKADDKLSREVLFKWSDCVIRGKDPAHQEEAEKNLRTLTESKDQDRWWTEAGVTLSELYIEKDPYGKQADIKKWLDAARDYWAGSDDLETARSRFITISFTLADYVTSRWGWYTTDIKPVRLDAKSVIAPTPQPQGNEGLQVLFEEVLKVAKSDQDKAHAHYGLAMAYMQNYSGDQKIRDKALEHFKKVIGDYSRSEWADDAFYQTGMYYENQSNYVKAATTYKEFLDNFHAGESQWVDDAKNRLKQIIDPMMGVSVSNTFIPGSEIQFGLSWRNLKSAKLTFYKFDLSRELALTRQSDGQPGGFSSYSEMLREIVETTGRYKSFPVALTWTADLDDDGKHVPHSEYKGMAEWRLKKGWFDREEKADPKNGTLPSGAYLLVAEGEDTKPAYELVLVSDLAVVSKVAKSAALFFAMDAKTGKPAASTSVKFIYSYYDDQGYSRWTSGEGMTDENGLLKAPLKTNSVRNYSQQHTLFATASADDGARQAFVQNSYYNYSYNNHGEWWLYAFGDRPAYRPGETVNFKGIMRHYDGGALLNTAGMQVKARLYDPQGNQIKEGTYTLNDYGAFDDTLTLDEKAALGEYRVELYTADMNTHLATATIFRTEEYKLPEFIVNIKPKSKDEKAAVSTYRLGDSVTVEIDAQYYFGGPVANAQVEYLVYQAPFYHQYQPVRPYAWYYQDMYQRNNYYYGYGSLIKQEKIKTDGEGKAHFTIDTPKDSGNDLQYHVEVRVVDQSRREIRSTGDIKVTKNAFFADLEAKQNLYRPGDKAQVMIKTVTANDEPVAIEGKVTISRNWWREPVMKGEAVANPGGYDNREIMTKFVKTNERGEATFEFEPSEDGYYQVEFTGFDNGNPVTGRVNIFVCATSSTNIGYRYGGLQIITEKDTYAPGEVARAMIVSDQPDTYVLLTEEADDVYGYEMLHLEGSVKLVEISVKDNYTPNVFVNALSADHYQMKSTQLQLVVPPAAKFLNVKVTSDKEVYQPQEDGSFEIEVTDKDGKPAANTEVALGLTDAAVYYIQGEYAPDIRQFFYGDKRQMSIQTQTSFNQRAYINLVRGEQGDLITDDERDRRRRAEGARNNRADMPVAQSEMEYRDKDIGAANAVGGKGDMLAKQKSISMPAATAAPAREMMADEKKEVDKIGVVSGRLEEAQKKPSPIEGVPAGQEDQPEQVRNDFRSTVIWQPSVITDASGKAVVKAKFPDSLTTWRLTARADTPGTAVGTVTHEVKSNKNLMIRLQAPRFFTERDIVTVSALVDNLSDNAIKVFPSIKAEGLQITGQINNGKPTKSTLISLEVPAHGQKRIDWEAVAVKAGTAKITVFAKADKISDAMEKTYPVIPHGIEKFIAQSTVLKGKEGEQTKELTINIPKERIKESTSLRINISPSMAANLLDALPYLADYPYGCVEQTMSRFLPAVIVAKTMRALGISAQEVDAYIADVLEPRNDPQGHPQRRNDSTYSRLNQMTADSLKRLYDFQHSDGGWGWWKHGDSDRFMTAYVIWGLGLARDAGIDVKGEAIATGTRYLQIQLVEEEDHPDMLAWMLHALASVNSTSEFENKQRTRLWDMRDKLNPYTRALYALSENRRGEAERAKILAQNVLNGIDEDQQNGTAHWGESGVNYRWSDGGVEATAFTVKALSQIDPQSQYLDEAVKWLSLNRRGASWKNTRDTAIAILGLADYLKATRELSPDYSYQILVNGKVVREGKVDSSNVFSFNRIIDIPSDQLRDGDNKVKIVMNGQGALYAAAYAKYFTLEEGITKAGNEIFVERKYYKQSVKPTLMKGYNEDWAPLKDGDHVQSGDRIRVDVTLDAKNNYEYLLAEDYKPAGLEAVELKSGPGAAIDLGRDGRESDGRTPLYQEFRDQKAAFFIAHIKQGKHLIRYELRAEVPGEFHGMPDQAHAMYVPEIRASSDEMRVSVDDAPSADKGQ